MTNSLDIVNQAILLVSDNQPLVTGTAPTFDNSTAGKAAQVLYGPTVRFVGRQFGWDFARKTVALVLTGNTPPQPWTYEYSYPPNGIQVWDIFPDTEDPLDPLPYDYNEANAVVAAVVQRVIQTNVQNAQAVYNNNPNESTWDSSFEQAVVQMLSRGFAIALTGKTDLMQAYMESFGTFEQAAESRQD